MGLLSTFASLGGSSVGTGVVDLQLNTASFDRGLATSQGKLKGATAAMGGSVSRLSQLTTLGVAGIAVGVGAAAVATVNAASDQEEALNKTNVVFGNLSETVTKFADTSATAFGISKTAALQAAGGFGQMLQTAGLAQDEAAEMSVALVKLAADLASFNNIDPTEAMEKLRSGLAGEAEPLRTMGVFLSETRVQAEAFSSGIAKAGSELTEAQKVQARYNLILQDSKLAQGDFARTSDSLANQQRILSAEFSNLAADIGKKLLPAAVSLLGVLNDLLKLAEPLITAIGETAGAFNDMGEAMLGITAPWNQVNTNIDVLVNGLKNGQLSIQDFKDAIDIFRDKFGDSNIVVVELEKALGRYIDRQYEATMQSREAGRGLEQMGRDARAASGHFQGLGEDATAAQRRINRFAGLSAEALNEWKADTRSSLREVSLQLGGVGDKWKQTANQTIRAARQMARDAETIATDLDKLADIRAPDTFKRWLVDQGPGWVHGYVTATKTGKDRIEGYWRDASRSVRDQKDALDDVTSKVDRIGQKVRDLPDQKVIDIRLNVTGVSDTEAGQHIADSLANEWVRGGG